ncbi:MAG: peptidoglycan editing factor PgeF [Phaeodactylibacter sp.]|uniref:peptidoglycan editing factor PgeF n=1 Tax=Phaeodactylibacter sp. TaxID=1940289 RepID=UPI0032ED6A96
MMHQPQIFALHPVVAAESQRSGGVSPAPYHSLNLGINTEDAPEHIGQNRQRFFKALGWPDGAFCYSYQVHGKEVLVATAPGGHHGYDAIITKEPGLLIGVTIADCTPVLVFDPKERAVAAIHAGWQGTAAQIVTHTLNRMEEAFGTHPEDCLAYIGTCITQPHYEVDERVAGRLPKAHLKPGVKPGKWLADLKGANQAQLLDAGIPEAHIEVSPYCTWADNDHYFSHRRNEGTTGRMMAVIGIQNKPL